MFPKRQYKSEHDNQYVSKHYCKELWFCLRLSETQIKKSS